MKKHMPKNKFFVSYISNFLLQYKIKKKKKIVQLMVTNKIQKKGKKKT